MRTIGDKEMDVLVGALRAAQESLKAAADALANMQDPLCAPVGEVAKSAPNPCIRCAYNEVEAGSSTHKAKCVPCEWGSNWKRKP